MLASPKYVITCLVLVLLVCPCAGSPTTIKGYPAVGTIQGNISMNWTINTTDISSNRFVVNPSALNIIFFPANSVLGNVAAVFTNRVRDVSNVSQSIVSFTLLNVTVADAGRYFFKISPNTDAGGQVLVVAGYPGNVSVQNISFPCENKEYKLQCSAESTSVPLGTGLTMQYQWKRGNGQIITASDRYSFSSDQSTLIINPLKKIDNGTVVCEAWDHVGAVSRSDPFPLIVNCTVEQENDTDCKLELGLALGHGLGIPCLHTVIIVVIFVCTAYTYPYNLGLVHGVGLGVTFQVGWIIIACLISTGNKCNLELGLGLGLSSGMLYVIAFIVSVIFVFFTLSIFKDIPGRVELGKGMLTGLLCSSVIGIIVVYLIYDKLKREQTCSTDEGNPQETDGKKSEQELLEKNVKKGKTNNSGSSSAVSREHVSVQMENKGFKSDEDERPPAVHMGTQNKVDPNTSSKQTNDRQQPVPPANTVFEDTPTFRQLPPPPQNGKIKDRNMRGISATIGDAPDLAGETPRPNRLLPLAPKQATVQMEDASEEPKKKRKKKKKKDQINKETPEEENGKTF